MSLGFLEAFRALLGFMYRAMSKPAYERVNVGVKRVHLEVLSVGWWWWYYNLQTSVY